MNKRIIIVGPSASGKNVLRERFIKKGFRSDVSYTSRKLRHGETNGKDYYFCDIKEFKNWIDANFFYEWVEYEGTLYGTSNYNWHSKDVFIMETDGVGSIKKEDRDHCFIIYLDVDRSVRTKRMKEERKWNKNKIEIRIKEDTKKFKGFSDHDLRITNPHF